MLNYLESKAIFLKTRLEASAAENWFEFACCFLKVKWEEVKGKRTKHIVNTHESNYYYLSDNVCCLRVLTT